MTHTNLSNFKAPAFIAEHRYARLPFLSTVFLVVLVCWVSPSFAGSSQTSTQASTLPQAKTPSTVYTGLFVRIFAVQPSLFKNPFMLKKEIANSEHRLRYDIFFLGVLLSLGLYQLAFFIFMRRSYASLYLALTSFGFGIMNCAINPNVSQYTFAWLPSYLVFRIPYLTFSTVQLLSLLFLEQLFPDEFSRTVKRILQGSTALVVAIVLFTPSQIHTPTINLFMMASMFFLVYALVVTIQAYRNQREGSFLLFCAFFLMACLGIYHSASNNMDQGPGNLVILVLVFSFALILARRFAHSLVLTEQLSKEMEEKNLELLRLDQLKNEFLANTSHELRTPLNGIIGLAESLYDGVTGELPRQTRGNLSLIIKSGKRLSHLINDLLDFSKLSHNELILDHKVLDIKTVVDIVLTISQTLASGKDVTLINNIPLDFPKVWADEDRVQQILFNLIGNAIKFTNEGEVRCSARVTNGNVEIAISDTGIGIASEQLDDIFSGFTQADGSSERRYDGAGLGLAITNQLVGLHGGAISVQSKFGEGSQFVFTLPLYQAQDSNTIDEEYAPLPQAGTPIPESTLARIEEFDSTEFLSGRSGTFRPFSSQEFGIQVDSDTTYSVLIVDDQVVNLKVLENFLNLEEYEVRQASNGIEMLEHIENMGIPNIVILDVMMPVMSGYEACRKLREKYSIYELPVLMLTAKTQAFDVVEGFLAGANDYITKPFNKDELLSRIRTHLELSLLTRSLEEQVKERTESLQETLEQLKKQHNQLVEAQTQLVQSEKMASLGTLVAGIAHEINNPANFLVHGGQNLNQRLQELHNLIVELLGEDADSGVLQLFDEKLLPIRENLSAIEEGALRIQKIVKALRSFSRLDEADQKKVNIVDGIQLALSLVEANFKPHVKVETNFQDDPLIECWPADLNQAFTNIIVNACQAIRTKQVKKKEDSPGTLHVSTKQSSDKLIIQFDDTGSGMTTFVQQRVFEPFFTTRDVGQGAGLGLSMTFGIIEKHNGTIVVESMLGEGTSVIIELPV